MNRIFRAVGCDPPKPAAMVRRGKAVQRDDVGRRFSEPLRGEALFRALRSIKGEDFQESRRF
ncbi:hypothetical protein PTKU46_92290 [Paraburkholderia terrae]